MVYGFDENTARQLVRLLYETRHQMNSLQGKVNRLAGAAAPRTTQYAIPKTTLEPGQTCEAYLAKYNSATGQLVANTRDTVTIKDLNSWAFAVGTDDYASSVHRLPVAKHPLARCWVVTSPTGLIQQAKPDSTIATGGSGTFSVYQNGTDTTVNVSNVNVTWGDDGKGVTAGQESWVRWNGAQWELIEADNDDEIGVGKGTLNSALATTDSTIGVTLDANSAVGSGTITANNFCGFSADNGAKCYVSTDGTTWELIQVACPA